MQPLPIQMLMTILTDFEFKQFIISMLIRIIYVLIVALTVLSYLALVFVPTFSGSDTVGFFLVRLIFGALGALISLALIRLGLECAIVFYRMYEELCAIAGKADGAGAPPVGAYRGNP